MASNDNSTKGVKQCVWTGLVAGDECVYCGYVLKRDYESAPRRECSKVTPRLRDTILRDSKEYPVWLMRLECQQLGNRTEHRVKEKCKNATAMLPVYRCEKWRLCSPFGNNSDSDLIHPCLNCEDYQPCQVTPTTSTS